MAIGLATVVDEAALPSAEAGVNGDTRIQAEAVKVLAVLVDCIDALCVFVNGKHFANILEQECTLCVGVTMI
jgi:hypothetical protein